MSIDKQKELIEIRKLYLTQFEKFETKVFLSWLAVFTSLFILYLKTNNYYIGLVTLFAGILVILADILIELWRKKNYNKLIKDIKSDRIGEILTCHPQT